MSIFLMTVEIHLPISTLELLQQFIHLFFQVRLFLRVAEMMTFYFQETME